jgi:uncharacterized phage protein gp47/JayE
MSKTPDVVAREILAKLAITAPGFSLELGTPERKIVDAVAESISEAYIDQYLIGSLLDIESKAGLELEQWVGTFGFGRLQGRKATGTVRVELTSANPQDLSLPVGSQFYTRQSLPSSGFPLYFSSTQAVVVPAGSFVVDVPVECTAVGTVGNVPPESVVYLGDILGATSVTNLQAFTGGVSVETDDELRQRFKDTFLRNVIGTEDWYLGMAYQNRNVSKAVCFGPVRKFGTQLEVTGNTVNLTGDTFADVKYAWPGDGHVYVFKNLGQSDETFYLPGVDYQWVAGTAPQFRRLTGGDIDLGEIIDLEFEYTTRSSRNDPVRGVTNKVDVFVNGSDPYTITERTIVSNAVTLSDTPTEWLYTGNFARVGGGTPAVNNRFTRLGSAPVISFPSTITAGGSTYRQNIDYWLLRPAPENTLNGTTLLAGSSNEVCGIEWNSTGPPSSVITPLTLTYVYNRVPEMLQAMIKTGKQLTTDVMVHQASYAYIRVYLSVEFDRGFVVSQVSNAIQERLRNYFGGLPYGSWVEVSDLTLAVHQVLGVDNVNLTLSGDLGAGVNHGIKVYGNSADTSPLETYDGDFRLADNQLPLFLDAVIRRKANR